MGCKLMIIVPAYLQQNFKEWTRKSNHQNINILHLAVRNMKSPSLHHLEKMLVMMHRSQKQTATSGAAPSAHSVMKDQRLNISCVTCVDRRENATKATQSKHSFPLYILSQISLQISNFEVAVPKVRVFIDSSTCDSNPNNHLIPSNADFS